MMRSRQLLNFVLSSALGFLSLPASASADDFYRGKQIIFVVSSDVGNSYDTVARIMARHLQRFIPGNPAVVVQNMPGAGGLRAMNWLYSAAPRDGLTIGMVNNTLAFDPLYGDKLAQFDAQKFNWLGTPNKDNGLFIVSGTLPIKSMADLRTRELVLSATGASSTPAFFARVFAALFDFKFKLIPGYKSQGEAFLAMERGENDGNASPFWASLKSDFPSWISEGKIRPLVYYGGLRDPEIPAPYALDLLSDTAKRDLLQVAQAGLDMGRPVLMPPAVDPARVKLLQDAMGAMLKDPEYLGECKQIAKLNCDDSTNAADLSAFVAKVYASPKEAVDRISAIYLEGIAP